MKISSEAVTDVGRKRKGNEDTCVASPEHLLFVVCDGMGGHAAGEVASRVAVDAIAEFVAMTAGDQEITWPFGLDESISYDGNRLKTAIRHANRRVLDAMRERPDYDGMATTVVAALVDGEVANIAHVGDSRLYLARQGALAQITSDHSWVNEQIRAGMVSPEQARTHPLRNVVTRALGGRGELLVDVQSIRLQDGDILLLCSDGLTTMVQDADIAEIVFGRGSDLAATAQALVDEANARGGEDNITVVLIRATDGT